MSQALLESLCVWMPELVLSLGAMLVMLLGAVSRTGMTASLASWLVLAGSAATLWMVQALPAGTWFFGLIALDPFSLVFRWVALGVVALVVLMTHGSLEVERTWTGEYLGVLLLLGAGLMLMAQAAHLLMAYLAIELVSLSGYVLVALARDARSSEAGLKYLLFGALSSGIMLFGMSLMFGMTGELSLGAIRHALGSLAPSHQAAAGVAVVLMLVGLAFKISMVPFHMWTPDVYEGAPIPVTALLSVGPKAAGLALLVRITQALAPVWEAVAPILVVLTIVTMTLGNVVALVQTNVKRLLAYSTIGQVGYLLIGFVVNTGLSLEALLVYVVAYLFMNLGAFACVVAVCRDTGSESLEAFRGLAQRAPSMALWCTLCLLSLAGIPPLLGFLGKFLLFGSAIEANRTIFAVAGVINSAIALYYYVNIIRQMYLEAPASPVPLRPSRPLQLAVSVCGLATIGLGLFPAPLLTAIGQTTGTLLF